jgi:Gpi18-like mannosyltransferase
LFKFFGNKLNAWFGNRRLVPFLFPALIIVAVIFRLAFFSNITDDLTSFNQVWYRYILTHGQFAALKDAFSNYTPPYLVLLTLTTYLKFLPDVTAIKLIPVVFDFLAAWLVYRLVAIQSADKPRAWMAFFAVLFSPVVLITSAYWGQIDIIYVVFLLAFALCILKEKPLIAMLFFSIALSFKLQAIFIAPLILVLILRKKIPWKYLLIPAPVYVLAAVPAWLAGRPLGELLSIYLQQSAGYRSLSKNAPNPYFFIPDQFYDGVVPVGLVVASLVLLALAFFIARRKGQFTQAKLLHEAVLFLSLAPFLLPKMHERYFFPAAVFAIVLAFYKPRLVLIALLFQLTLLLSYLPYLKGYPVIMVQLAAVANMGIVAALLISYFTQKPTFPTPGGEITVGLVDPQIDQR